MPVAVTGKRPPAARGRRLTAIELPPDLLRHARVYAATHDTTLRVLVEEGLRWRLGQTRRKEDDAMAPRPRGRRERSP
jgi:hypothetical protein